MSALSWLRVARRVPGLARQPELPNLETLIDEEALRIKDEYHVARWVVPLVLGVVGTAVFIPLAATIDILFLIGTAGMLTLGTTLGLIFHHIARRQSPTQIKLRKRCKTLMIRLVGLKNLLGFDPVLSMKVAAVLEEAAAIYLRTRPAPDRAVKPSKSSLWDDATIKAQRAMDEAMAQMLSLAEPETVQAQEVELARGWAHPLLEEMEAMGRALDIHLQKAQTAEFAETQLAPIAGLREARSELERLESAVSELEQEAR